MIRSELLRAFRRLRRDALATVGAVLALGVGIGLTLGAFGILHVTLGRGLPLPESERVVSISLLADDPALAGLPVDADRFEALRTTATEPFAQVAAFRSSFTFVGDDRAGTLGYVGSEIGPGLLDLLRVRPILGRSLVAADALAGAAPVVLLGHDAWRGQFHSDPAILGRTLRVNRELRTVVGILPAGFGFPFRQQVWTPLGDPSVGGPLFVVARLREGVSLATARARLEILSRQLAPPASRPTPFRVDPYTVGVTEPGLHHALRSVATASLLVLTGSCLSTALLIWTQLLRRRRELGMQVALGAPRRRLLLSAFADAAWLAGAGALVGLGLAASTLELFARLAVQTGALRAYWIAPRLDAHLLGAGAALAVASALAAGIVPALLTLPLARRETPGVAVSGSRHRTGGAAPLLVAAHTAVGCALLAGTCVTVGALWSLATFDYGFATERIWSAQISFYQARARAPEERRRVLDALLARLAGRPELGSVAFSTSVPGLGAPRMRVVDPASPIDTGTAASYARVSEDFFETYGLHALEGRLFHEDVSSGTPGVVISRSLARDLFGAEPAAGRSLLLESEVAEPSAATVVAVVPDLAFDGPDGRDRQAVYGSLSAAPPWSLFVNVRGSAPPSAIETAIRQELATLDPGAALYEAEPLPRALQRLTWERRATALAFALFGLAALGLAALGTAATAAYAVAAERRVAGVRAALGASPRNLFAHFLRQSLAGLAPGILAGTLLGAALVRALAAALEGVPAWAPGALGVAGVSVAMAALAGALGPAIGAAKADVARLLSRDS